MKKIIVGLVGETGSGKDTVADHLKEVYGAKLRRFANPIKDTLSIFFDKLSKEDQQWLYLKFKERFGEDILCQAMGKRIDGDEDQLIIVNGLRMLCDHDFIKSYPDSHVLYITADEELRWKRIASRGEKTDDDISFKKFQELEKIETEIHIPEIGKKADKTIMNDKSVEYLLEETDKFMEEIGVAKWESVNRKSESVKTKKKEEVLEKDEIDNSEDENPTLPKATKDKGRIETAGRMAKKPEFKRKAI